MKTFVSDSSANALNQNTQCNTYSFSTSLNDAFLSKTYGSNMSFCQKMFKIFIDSAQSDMDKLASSVKSNDFTEIKSIAHKIKNNFTWVGLPKLSEQMYNIENLARNQESGIQQKYNELNDSFRTAFEQVTAEYDSIVKYLEK